MKTPPALLAPAVVALAAAPLLLAPALSTAGEGGTAAAASPRASTLRAEPPTHPQRTDAREAGGAPMKRRKDPERWKLEARVGLSAGAFDGWTVRQDRGALVEAEGEVTTSVRLGARTRLELPLSLAHRETPGADLRETRGRLAAELGWRLAGGTRLALDGGVSATYRPDWPDLYQPVAGGSFVATDRFSHLGWDLGTQVTTRMGERQQLRVRYGFTSTSYAKDRVWDPVNEPLHLTPGDNARHEVAVSWRFSGEAHAVGVRAETFYRSDRYLLARDAGDGRTHFSTVPNDKQAFLGGEPSVEIEWRPAKPLELALRYGFEAVADTFDGYYSYTGHHPRLKVALAVSRSVTTSVTAEGWLREYGANGYAPSSASDPTPSHPPLDFGDRRVDRRGELGLEVGVKLARGLRATAEARWVKRITNFPDYVPGVFPASRQYDIDWDYVNWRAKTGLEYRW